VDETRNETIGLTNTSTDIFMKDKLTDLGLLWLRVFAGAGFMYHGWMKLTEVGVDVFAAKAVEPMGLPVPIVFAWLAVLSEFVGGFFLVLGLWTRIAAIFTAAVVGTAFFNVHAADPFARKEMALVYLVMATTIFIIGPGKFAVHASGKGRSSGSKAKGKKE
jgi:putative oxidoreductase